MKFLSLFLAAATLPACAQIPRGTSYAGVGITSTFTQSKPGGAVAYMASGVSLQPCFGWFVINNLSVGLQIDGYGQRVSTKPSWMTSETYSLGSSLFVRDYIPLKGKFYGLVVLDYGWHRGRADEHYPDWATLPQGRAPYRNGSVSSTVTASTFGARIGASWFMTPHTTLEATTGYTHRSNRRENMPFNGWGVEVGFRRWMFQR